jgi:hypothetical protein
MIAGVVHPFWRCMTLAAGGGGRRGSALLLPRRYLAMAASPAIGTLHTAPKARIGGKTGRCPVVAAAATGMCGEGTWNMEHAAPGLDATPL